MPKDTMLISMRWGARSWESNSIDTLEIRMFDVYSNRLPYTVRVFRFVHGHVHLQAESASFYSWKTNISNIVFLIDLYY